jgi:hypothetical protein
MLNKDTNRADRGKGSGCKTREAFPRVVEFRGRGGLKVHPYAPGAVRLRGCVYDNTWDEPSYGEGGCAEAHRDSV